MAYGEYNETGKAFESARYKHVLLSPAHPYACRDSATGETVGI